MRKLFFVAIAALSFSQEKPFERPRIASIKVLPGNPIIVPGRKVESAGGYWERDNGNRHLSDEEIGRYVRQSLKAGIIVTIYPDERGVFVTTECQKK